MNGAGSSEDGSTPLYTISKARIEKEGLKDELERMQPFIWRDLCSESDSDNFLHWLRSFGPGGYSTEFEVFLSRWIEDERRHAASFLKLYSELYSVPYDLINQMLAQRIVNFDPIASFLEDEFSVCVLIAYDEIATVMSYQQDVAFYDLLDKRTHGKLIRNVIKDEGQHFSSILDVIERCHSDRLGEIPSKLGRLLQWDIAKPEYQNTFVMDHSTFYFTPEILARCVHHVLKYFDVA